MPTKPKATPQIDPATGRKRGVNPKTGALMPVPPGRKKGNANKATVDARNAIAKFVDGNAGRLQRWLDQIAEKDPETAFKAFMSVVEYHIPKLQRSELTGKNGGAIEHNVQGMEPAEAYAQMRASVKATAGTHTTH